MEGRIKVWLFSVAVMMLIMVGLGGFTRLSEAGLSIVEWKPVTGIIPPLSYEDWQEEFEKYKKIEQWRRMHSWMTLDDFKKIYLIEYFHRLWGRILGLAVIIPAVVFSVRGVFSPFWKRFSVVLTVLIFVQGVLGWLMVKTGVEGERIFVDPLFLGFHHLFALFVYSFVLWGIWRAEGKPAVELKAVGKVRALFLILLVLFVVQFFIGTLTAGERACVIAPTYPDLNGELIPASLLESRKIFLNFVHRHFAVVLALPLFFALAVSPSVVIIPLVLFSVQFVLGVITLVKSHGEVPVLLGVAHQVNAWLFYTSVFYTFLRLKRPSNGQ